MALVNCPECQKEISDTVKKCPQCGFKQNKQNKKDKKEKTKKKSKIIEFIKKYKKQIIIGIIALLVILLAINCYRIYIYPENRAEQIADYFEDNDYNCEYEKETFNEYYAGYICTLEEAGKTYTYQIDFLKKPKFIEDVLLHTFDANIVNIDFKYNDIENREFEFDRGYYKSGKEFNGVLIIKYTDGKEDEVCHIVPNKEGKLDQEITFKESGKGYLIDTDYYYGEKREECLESEEIFNEFLDDFEDIVEDLNL